MTREIVLVAAMDRNRVIGREGGLPWRLPADLRHFREQTSGRTVLMGRKTYQSIGRPLPDRVNLVLTRDPDFSAPGVVVVHRPEQALERNDPELCVIGGEEVYRLFLPLATRQVLTLVDGEFEGDARYPEFEPAGWKEVSRVERAADAENPYACSFVTLIRAAVRAGSPG